MYLYILYYNNATHSYSWLYIYDSIIRSDFEHNSITNVCAIHFIKVAVHLFIAWNRSIVIKSTTFAHRLHSHGTSFSIGWWRTKFINFTFFVQLCILIIQLNMVDYVSDASIKHYRDFFVVWLSYDVNNNTVHFDASW